MVTEWPPRAAKSVGTPHVETEITPPLLSLALNTKPKQLHHASSMFIGSSHYLLWKLSSQRVMKSSKIYGIRKASNKSYRNLVKQTTFGHLLPVLRHIWMEWQCFPEVGAFRLQSVIVCNAVIQIEIFSINSMNSSFDSFSDIHSLLDCLLATLRLALVVDS